MFYFFLLFHTFRFSNSSQLLDPHSPSTITTGTVRIIWNLINWESDGAGLSKKVGFLFKTYGILFQNLPPPLLKMSETWKLALEVGRVPKGGLKITLKPINLSQGQTNLKLSAKKYAENDMVTNLVHHVQAYSPVPNCRGPIKEGGGLEIFGFL